MSDESSRANRERITEVRSGWTMLVVVLLLFVIGVVTIIASLVGLASTVPQPDHTGNVRAVTGQTWVVPLFVALLLLGIGCIVLDVFLLPGFFALQPNEARVLILFGAYKGTVRRSGFHWGNPFYSRGGWTTVPKPDGQGVTIARGRRYKVSLRARNFNGDKLKVNDKRGNPIEIAAVVVWKVRDTAQAMFDVDDFENYVRVQSESALRHLANKYAYDHGEEHEITLRSDVDEVSQALQVELQDRLATAGVFVEEARLTHLAYAPEIASAMLRRQQAEAIIAARQKIVHGAVSMVDMALKELAEKQVVQLDDERRAAMVSNLMVVLCGETEVRPVINTGTLYA